MRSTDATENNGEDGMRKPLKDSDGNLINADGHLHFGYGIPPVSVYAQVIERNGRLVALTPGHNPESAPVATIVRDFDCWMEPHVPMKAALDDSVHCIRCGARIGEAS